VVDAQPNKARLLPMSDIIALALAITVAAAFGADLRLPTSLAFRRPTPPRPRRVDISFVPAPAKPAARKADRRTEKSELYIGTAAIDCDGCALDAETVHRFVGRRIHQLVDCYERALRERPALDGTVELDFTIAATGLLERVHATGLVDLADRDRDGDLDPGGVARCVAEIVAALEFPESRTTARVRAPLTFRRAGL
jgi:hypothetical protein